MDGLDPAALADMAVLARGLKRSWAARKVREAAAAGPAAERPWSYYRDKPVEFARDVLGVVLTPDQEEIARAFPGRVKVNAAHSVGKCLDANERVPLADGRVVAAGDLVGRYFGVMAWRETGEQVPALAFAEDNGVRPVYRVETSSGRVVFRTAEHPLWCGEKQYGGRVHVRVKAVGWKRVDEIRPGDHVLVPTRLGVAGRRPRSEDHVKLAAYLLGDGGTTTRVTFTQTEGKVKDEFRDVVRRLGGEPVESGVITIGVRGVGDDDPKTAGRNPVLNLVRSWGLIGTKSKDKSFPDWVWELPNDQLALFLNRLFACDGWAYAQDVRNVARIGICLASERMIRDVELAMLRLGIAGRVRHKPVKFNGVLHHSWEWVVYTGTGLIRFAETVGIFGKEGAVDRVTVVASRLNQSRVRKWRTLGVPDGYVWDTVRSVEVVGERPTVSICVPGHETFLTTFVEHNSFLAAVLILWWWCTRDPGVIVTTAPTRHHVESVLWTHVRVLALKAKRAIPGRFLPKAAKIEDHPEHWAEGVTAATGEGFQGKHFPSMFFVYDEAEDIDPIFWEVTDTMYDPAADHAWFAIGNPVSTKSRSYAEDQASDPAGNPKWRGFTLSALTHPNVLAGLHGRPGGIPNAISLAQVEQEIVQNCEPVRAGEVRRGDFEWRPGTGRFYRPNSIFKGRMMGVRPTEGVDTVFGEDLWQLMTTPHRDPRDCWRQNRGVTVGVDVATYGDDHTVFHVRTGPLSLHHESVNGWLPDRVAGRVKELCREWSAWYNTLAENDRPPLLPKDVKVVIELDGPGVGVLSHCAGFGNWSGIKVAESSDVVDQTGCPVYANVRSELWFAAADAARGGGIDLSRLPKDVLGRLKLQLLTPAYEQKSNGTRHVEEKKDIKKRLPGNKSPDDADGLLVCYYDGPSYTPEVLTKKDEPEYY